jgi:hypothetical protein
MIAQVAGIVRAGQTDQADHPGAAVVIASASAVLPARKRAKTTATTAIADPAWAPKAQPGMTASPAVQAEIKSRCPRHLREAARVGTVARRPRKGVPVGMSGGKIGVVGREEVRGRQEAAVVARRVSARRDHDDRELGSGTGGGHDKAVEGWERCRQAITFRKTKETQKRERTDCSSIISA